MTTSAEPLRMSLPCALQDHEKCQKFYVGLRVDADHEFTCACFCHTMPAADQ